MLQAGRRLGREKKRVCSLDTNKLLCTVQNIYSPSGIARQPGPIQLSKLQPRKDFRMLRMLPGSSHLLRSKCQRPVTHRAKTASWGVSACQGKAGHSHHRTAPKISFVKQRSRHMLAVRSPNGTFWAVKCACRTISTCSQAFPPADPACISRRCTPANRSSSH